MHDVPVDGRNNSEVLLLEPPAIRTETKIKKLNLDESHDIATLSRCLLFVLTARLAAGQAEGI